MQKLTPIQVFNAVTINAAYSICRSKSVGSLDKGKSADITIFDAPNIDFPLYFLRLIWLHMYIRLEILSSRNVSIVRNLLQRTLQF